MALAKVGQVMGAEIISKNRAREYVNLELDTGEKALLPLAQMLGDNSTQKRWRFDALQEDSEITVIVIHDRSGDEPFFIVSELIEKVRVNTADQASTSTVQSLAERFPTGRSLRGKPRRTQGGFNILVDGTTVFLPNSNLSGTKPESLKPTTDVKVFVHEVTASGKVIVGRAQKAS